MEERRIAHRWDLLLFLPTYEHETQGFLGYDADMTEQGLLVFSGEHIELGKEYTLEVRLDDLEEALLHRDIDANIVTRARTRWVDLDVKPSFHRTGFMFTGLDEDNKRRIRQLVKNIAHNLQ